MGDGTSALVRRLVESSRQIERLGALYLRTDPGTPSEYRLRQFLLDDFKRFLGLFRETAAEVVGPFLTDTLFAASWEVARDASFNHLHGALVADDAVDRQAVASALARFSEAISLLSQHVTPSEQSSESASPGANSGATPRPHDSPDVPPADTEAGRSSETPAPPDDREREGPPPTLEPTSRSPEQSLDLVTLDQAAAMVHKSKRTLERYKTRGTFPAPAVEGGGGRADLFDWKTLRPWLTEVFGIPLPEGFPKNYRS